MKRDWDIIRSILIALEDLDEDSKSFTTNSLGDENASSVSYHVQILHEAGLIEASISAEIGSSITSVTARRMTWAGHELLDSIRNDSIWARTKGSFKDKGMTMTFDLVKAVATALIKEALT